MEPKQHIISDACIKKHINKYLPIRNLEKKINGEVFTPPELINDMLNVLPDHVWSNCETRWFDPTCGVGNFMAVIYQRLMNNTCIKNTFPNCAIRSNHILTNMLFMCELNPENVTKCKTLFGNNANIYCEDFLQHSESYDIIVGNPPFGKICNNIITRAILLSKIILFVLPSGVFRGGSNKLYNTLVEYNRVRYINFDKKISSVYFKNIQQSICYCLLEMSNLTKLTNIIDSNNNMTNVKLSKHSINPICFWTQNTFELTKLYLSNTKNSIIYHRGNSLKQYYRQYKNDIFNCPVVYTKTKIIYGNKNNHIEGMGVPKIIIFAICPTLDVFFDINGEYGVGPNTFYYPFKSALNGFAWLLFFNSNEYKMIIESTRTHRQFLNGYIIQHLTIAQYIF